MKSSLSVVQYSSETLMLVSVETQNKIVISVELAVTAWYVTVGEYRQKGEHRRTI